jgi:hypothetical protein
LPHRIADPSVPQTTEKQGSIPPMADTNLVRIICAANEQELPLAGRKIGTVKRSLREVLNIGYFADPWLNGRIATLDDKLSAGDVLEFVVPFGFKGGEGQPPYQVQLAEALIANDPELQAIAVQVKSERLPASESVDRTLRLTTDYLMRRFGKPTNADQPVLDEMVHQLITMAVRVKEFSRSGQPVAPPPAVYFDQSAGTFFVHGIPTKGLSPAQDDVLQALYEAGQEGLSKDELEAKSGHSDARGILKRLVEDDSEWAAVIHFAGKAHRGYRLG